MTFQEAIKQAAEEFRKTKRPYMYRDEQAGKWCTGPGTIHDRECFKEGIELAVRLMMAEMSRVTPFLDGGGGYNKDPAPAYSLLDHMKTYTTNDGGR